MTCTLNVFAVNQHIVALKRSQYRCCYLRTLWGRVFVSQSI